MSSGVRVIDFTVHSDSRGSLVALESDKEIPFAVRRVYYIYGTQAGVARGFHAHRNLKQLLVAVSGSVTILCEHGTVKENFRLDSPSKGLLIEGLVWREMFDFSDDCVLMVLASEYYDEEDYIRNYLDFQRENG